MLAFEPWHPQSLLCTTWEDKDPCFDHAASSQSNQTGLMSSLVQVIAVHKVKLLVVFHTKAYFIL